MGAETAGRIAESAYHAHKLRPYRQAARAERRLEIYYFKNAARLLVLLLGRIDTSRRNNGFLLCRCSEMYCVKGSKRYSFSKKYFVM